MIVCFLCPTRTTACQDNGLEYIYTTFLYIIIVCIYEKPTNVLTKNSLCGAFFCLESGSNPWKSI